MTFLCVHSAGTTGTPWITTWPSVRQPVVEDRWTLRPPWGTPILDQWIGGPPAWGVHRCSDTGTYTYWDDMRQSLWKTETHRQDSEDTMRMRIIASRHGRWASYTVTKRYSRKLSMTIITFLKRDTTYVHTRTYALAEMWTRISMSRAINTLGNEKKWHLA